MNSLRSRAASASVRLLDAAAEVLPLPRFAVELRDGFRLASAIQAYQLSAALHAARRLDLFAYLERPRTARDVAEHCGIAVTGAEVLLGALEQAGAVSRRGASFVLTAPGRALFGGGPWRMGNASLDMLEATWPHWIDLAGALTSRDGHPILRVYNPDNPCIPQFVRLTNAVLAAPARALVAALDLSRTRRMIAGTVGVSFASAVARANPAVEVTISCLESLIRELPAAIERYRLPPPAEVIVNTGDAARDRWGAAETYDLVFLARKFAFCGTEHGIEYLRKTREVLSPEGHLILWEPFAEHYEATPSIRASIELIDAMLGEAHPLRTEAELVRYAREARFRRVEVRRFPRLGTSFVVARR